MTPLLPLLTETVADLIIQKMQSDFNPILQTADFMTYTDGISLKPIENNHYYVANTIDALELPACYVLFGNHAFQYSENQNYLISNDRCLVVITMEEVGDQSVTRMAWRYGRALFGCLNLARLVDVEGADNRIEIYLIPQSLAYTQEIGKKMDDRENRFRKDVVLELKIEHFEKNLT